MLCAVVLLVSFGYSKDEASKTVTTSMKPKCKDGQLYFSERCFQPTEIQGIVSSDFAAMLDGEANVNARSEQQVKETVGILFDKYMTDSLNYEIYTLFSKEIHKRSNDMSEKGLRLLLDVSYYHDHFSNIAFAEISEGWRDGVIPYIKKETKLVVSVFQDKNQLNRQLIFDAFYQFVDPFGVDAEGNINDERFSDKHKKLQLLFNQEGI